MLLRSITKHVKDQNWFAVCLDFLIVVVGVFVGLQVQNWANEQGRQQLEHSYTARLHEEVMDLQNTRAPLVAMRETWGALMTKVSPVLFGEEAREISVKECEAIAYSYIVSNPTDDVASLNELQQSGQLSLFRNKRVSKALNDYLLVRARARDSRAGISSEAAPMALLSKYPHFINVIKYSVHEIDRSEFAAHECDILGMRSDQSFLNDFQIVQSNYVFHVGDNARVSNSLNELHQTLDEVLGIHHPDQNKAISAEVDV